MIIWPVLFLVAVLGNCHSQLSQLQIIVFPFFLWQRRIIALYFGCLHAAFSTDLLNIHTHKFRQQPSFSSWANCVLLASCPRIDSLCPWTSYSPFSVPVSVWICLNSDTLGKGIHTQCSRPAWYRKLAHLPGLMWLDSCSRIVFHFFMAISPILLAILWMTNMPTSSTVTASWDVHTSLQSLVPKSIHFYNVIFYQYFQISSSSLCSSGRRPAFPVYW